MRRILPKHEAAINGDVPVLEDRSATKLTAARMKLEKQPKAVILEITWRCQLQHKFPRGTPAHQVQGLAKRFVMTPQKDQTLLIPRKDFHQHLSPIGNAAPEGRRLGYWFEFFALVEAAGIEPLFPLNLNPMMANDFGFYRVKTFVLPRRFDSP